MHCFQASFIALDFPLMWQRTSLYWKKQSSVTSVKHTIKIHSLTRWRTFLKRLAKRAADLVHGGNASSSCNHAKGPDLIGLVMEAPLRLTHQDFKTHCTSSLKRLSNLNLPCKTPVNTSRYHVISNFFFNCSFPRPICKTNAFNMGKSHNLYHMAFRWALQKGKVSLIKKLHLGHTLGPLAER